MPTTITQRIRRTPGARTFWHRGQQSVLNQQADGSLVVPWTIIGRKSDAFGSHQMTATAFGRTEEEAVERFLSMQSKRRPNVFGDMPPTFERHELRAEREDA